MFETKDFQKFPFRLPNRRKYSDSERQTDGLPTFVMGFLGLPLLVGLAMMPFWDQIGDWRIFAAINGVLAPAIEKLPNLHQHSVTQRRFMIGGSVLLYALFLCEFLVLLVWKKRRFLYLEYYDLRKLRFCGALIVSWACMALSWYLVFVNDTWTHEFAGSGKLLGALIVLFPVLTLHVAQMTTIALFGIVRDISHLPRHLR